jgi:aminoglycoside phosphotransferase (APT) family kinase protein
MKPDSSSIDPRSKIESYLQSKYGPTTKVQSVVSLVGGACQDNYRVQFFEKNDTPHDIVLRSDKGGSLLSSLSKETEFKVCELAFQKGVKTPKPYFLEKDPSWLGTPFYTMQRISGNASPKYIIKDKEIQDYRKSQLIQDLAKNLAIIHSIQPVESVSIGTNDVDEYHKSILQSMRDSLDELLEPRIAVELVLNWIRDKFPKIQELSLVHGDFRTGNFLVSPSGLEGIVDWEFAHWGDPMEDLAWLCLRDWRFGKLKLEAGGFSTRSELYSEYERFSKSPLDPKRVLFWEIIGNLRWAVGTVQQAERHLRGKDKGIELLSIGRRTCEIEHEMMRLVEKYESGSITG